ncbi:putative DsbA family dithiol-disulfide isomerase [Actinoplanes tereljensis]|uniref:DSBA oxidoreductase n=1 Tax=Paractinoplanes tereljensis TaxID=571912 RepID=A0A919NVA6_9ACTN|nr:DsbA family oxidoreductase [Actinoplanes tereljensis]GIF24915.1 DSBA oxidoreductase [Actinoplanes tereljensis]
MDIQVWSDVVCPWCYLGKARLEKAIAQFDGDVTVTYRAFQLDPAPVPRPVPIRDAMAAKVGGWNRAEEMLAHVTSIAAADGLRLDYDRAIAANTFDSHRLIAWASGQGRQADMLDALQRAHFTGGADLGSRPALAGVAASIGLDGAAALAYLESEAGTGAVTTDLTEARELGITSVPTFLIDGKYTVQGAQEPATLLAALEEIARREAVDIDL